MSEEEVEQMVRDAEAHAEEDKKFEELVQLRNQADGMIHATRKTLEEAGDKATDDEKQAIETAISELEEAVKGDDVDNIQKKLDALTEASGKLAQKMYAEQAEAAQQEGGEGAESTGSKPEDDVVDAEYEEVNDDQKKQ